MVDLSPIGRVESDLLDPVAAPRQGREGAPDAWLVIDPAYAEGLEGLRVGDELVVLTWLHLAQRDVLQVHPRGEQDRPLQGVFGLRSQDRPNPIGLHQVTIKAIEGVRLAVGPLEAVDGTPVLDLKIAI